MRLPSGEGVLTRLNRVQGLLELMKDGKQPPKRAVARALVEYHSLLQNLWLWQVKKK